MEQSSVKHPSAHRRLVRSRRALLVLLTASACALLTSGCQVGYLVRSAYDQTSLLRGRVPIAEALKDPNISADNKRKLQLAEEAHAFAENELGLKHTKSYTTYVQLNRPYVTYVVAAASRSELKAYRWWFPIVGSLPYKGFFNPDDANAEAKSLKDRGYDTFTRGVSAYSTLGWFDDPILSSMLTYEDFDLVNTIIHETTHATIYIKSQADFNERLAVFIGDIGTREFYRKKEGADSPTLKKMEAELADERLFAKFISAEMQSLEKWYSERKDVAIDEDDRRARLKEIQTHFAAEVRPQLKLPTSYKNFDSIEINNARLLNYRLYFENLDDFENVFRKLGSDFKKMLDFCKTLEKSEDPKKELALAANQTAAS